MSEYPEFCNDPYCYSCNMLPEDDPERGKECYQRIVGMGKPTTNGNDEYEMLVAALQVIGKLNDIQVAHNDDGSTIHRKAG